MRVVTGDGWGGRGGTQAGRQGGDGRCQRVWWGWRLAVRGGLRVQGPQTASQSGESKLVG